MKHNPTRQCLALAALAALLFLGRSAQAQTEYMDVNGSANTGFGDFSISPSSNPNVQSGQTDHYNFSGSTNYNTDPTGGAGGTIQDFVSGDTVVFDLSQTTASPYDIRVNSGSYNVGGLSLVNAGTYTLGLDPAAYSSRNYHFSGGTLNVGASGSTLAFNSGYVGIQGNFTKTGAGTAATYQTSSAAGSYVGTGTLSGGTFSIGGSTATGTSSNFVINGGSLFINNTGTNVIGGLSGTGSGSVTSSTGAGSLQVATSLAPSTNTSIQTLNIALSGGKSLDISTIAAGGLKFNLASPGASDEVLFSGGGLNVGSGVIGWNSFTFNNEGATAGTYTLFDASAGNGISGTLGSNLTGMVGSLNGTLMFDNNTSPDLLELVLTGSAPEPSTYALLLGGMLALGLCVRRRRLA